MIIIINLETCIIYMLLYFQTLFKLECTFKKSHGITFCPCLQSFLSVFDFNNALKPINIVVIIMPFNVCVVDVFLQSEVAGTCACTDTVTVFDAINSFFLPVWRQLEHVQSSQQHLVYHPTANESRLADVN